MSTPQDTLRRLGAALNEIRAISKHFIAPVVDLAQNPPNENLYTWTPAAAFSPGALAEYAKKPAKTSASTPEILEEVKKLVFTNPEYLERRAQTCKLIRETLTNPERAELFSHELSKEERALEQKYALDYYAAACKSQGADIAECLFDTAMAEHIFNEIILAKTPNDFIEYSLLRSSIDMFHFGDINPLEEMSRNRAAINYSATPEERDLACLNTAILETLPMDIPIMIATGPASVIPTVAFALIDSRHKSEEARKDEENPNLGDMHYVLEALPQQTKSAIESEIKDADPMALFQYPVYFEHLTSEVFFNREGDIFDRSRSYAIEYENQTGYKLLLGKEKDTNGNERITVVEKPTLLQICTNIRSDVQNVIETAADIVKGETSIVDIIPQGVKSTTERLLSPLKSAFFESAPTSQIPLSRYDVNEMLNSTYNESIQKSQNSPPSLSR